MVVKKRRRFGFLSYTSVFWPVGHGAEENLPGVSTLKVHTSYQPGERALEMPGAPPLVLTTPDKNELEMMRSDVRSLRAVADVVVISFHWGISGSSNIVGYQQEVGRAAIDAGADLVIGHHPHVLQGIEVWQGKPIFYSLGNFVFDWDRMKDSNLEGLLVRYLLQDNRTPCVSFIPTRRNKQNDVEILNLSTPSGKEIANNIEALSAEFGTEIAYSENEITVRGVS